MRIEDSVFEHITSDPVVNGFIGTRFYPNQASESAIRPYCVYSYRDRLKPARIMGVQSSVLIITIHSEAGADKDQYQIASDIDRAITAVMLKPITSNETHCFIGVEFSGSTDAYSTTQVAHQHSVVASYQLTTQSIQ